MRISLDTNVWIFGLLANDVFCEKIIDHLNLFEVIIPGQVRIELERNLSTVVLKKLYQIAQISGVQFNFEQVPDIYIRMFEAKGLKKGDAIIGGFCEWKQIEAIVSDNRDFLKGLATGHFFTVMSPEEFCKKAGL